MKTLFGNVVDINDDGQGVIKCDGKVYFVSYVLIGEEIEFEIKKEYNKFGFGELKRIIKPSKNRVKAICEAFEKCGGCDYLNLSYSDELLLKQQKVQKQLRKYGCGISKIVASEKELYYRNKIKLCVKDNICGMQCEKTHNICAIKKCYICDEFNNELICIFNEYLKANNDSGIFEIVIRFLNNQLIIEIKTKNNDIYSNNLINMINKTEKDFTLFVITDNKTKCVYGPKQRYDELFGIKYSVSQGSFLQVNNYIKQLLYDSVIENLNSDCVVDAYSGAGLLSGIIAKQKKKCFGIELFKNAHYDAEKLKLENNLSNLTNICGDCKTVLPDLLKKNLQCRFDVVLDPPRSGCDKNVLIALNATRSVSRIVYVSCNLATLVRDLDILSNSYIIKKIQPFDMFPKTAHVETLVVLESKNKVK